MSVILLLMRINLILLKWTDQQKVFPNSNQLCEFVEKINFHLSKHHNFSFMSRVGYDNISQLS
jgi:hypothetical protein